jgi:hypothetical protein
VCRSPISYARATRWENRNNRGRVGMDRGRNDMRQRCRQKTKKRPRPAGGRVACYFGLASPDCSGCGVDYDYIIPLFYPGAPASPRWRCASTRRVNEAPGGRITRFSRMRRAAVSLLPLAGVSQMSHTLFAGRCIARTTMSICLPCGTWSCQTAAPSDGRAPGPKEATDSFPFAKERGKGGGCAESEER